MAYVKAPARLDQDVVRFNNGAAALAVTQHFIFFWLRLPTPLRDFGQASRTPETIPAFGLKNTNANAGTETRPGGRSFFNGHHEPRIRCKTTLFALPRFSGGVFSVPRRLACGFKFDFALRLFFRLRFQTFLLSQFRRRKRCFFRRKRFSLASLFR
jgi:hypothetical protein